MRSRLISITLVFALLLAVLTGCSNASNEKTAQSTSLHIVLAMPLATEQDAAVLKESLIAAAPELDSEALPLDVAFIATGDTEKDPAGAMAGMTQVTTRMMTGEIELMICDSDNARRHGDNGETYVPLNELFTEEEIVELGIVPATVAIVGDAGTITDDRSAPCGVDLSGNANLVKMLGISDPGAYVIVDSPNLENAKIAIKALLTL